MMKSLFIAAIFGLAISAPAYADEMMKCDDATVMKMQTEVDATSDMAKKEMAMKEMDMAKMAMTDGKTDDCSMHLGEAMKAVAK